MHLAVPEHSMSRKSHNTRPFAPASLRSAYCFGAPSARSASALGLFPANPPSRWFPRAPCGSLARGLWACLRSRRAGPGQGRPRVLGAAPEGSGRIPAGPCSRRAADRAGPGQDPAERPLWGPCSHHRARLASRSHQLVTEGPRPQPAGKSAPEHHLPCKFQGQLNGDTRVTAEGSGCGGNGGARAQARGQGAEDAWASAPGWTHTLHPR